MSVVQHLVKSKEAKAPIQYRDLSSLKTFVELCFSTAYGNDKVNGRGDHKRKIEYMDKVTNAFECTELSAKSTAEEFTELKRYKKLVSARKSKFLTGVPKDLMKKDNEENIKYHKTANAVTQAIFRERKKSKGVSPTSPMPNDELQGELLAQFTQFILHLNELYFIIYFILSNISCFIRTQP